MPNCGGVQATISFKTTSTEEGALGDVVVNHEEEIFNQDIRYIVSRVDKKGFVIILNKPAPFDVEFDWLALAIKNPKLFSAPVDVVPEDVVVIPINDGSSSFDSSTTLVIDPALEVDAVSTASPSTTAELVPAFNSTASSTEDQNITESASSTEESVL